MTEEKIISADDAYSKTNELLAAYSTGDLLGGNPMQWIEKYAQQVADHQTSSLRKELEDCQKLLHEQLTETNKERAKSAKLLEAAKQMMKSSCDLMKHCVDMKFINVEDETDGYVGHETAISNLAKVISDYEKGGSENGK